MSAVGELYQFGFVFICLSILILTIFIRAHTAMAEKVPVIFLICNFLIMFSMYMMFAYPVRNALRYFWIGVFLFVAVDFAKRRWSKEKHPLKRTPRLARS
jgi:hypothetical protein